VTDPELASESAALRLALGRFATQRNWDQAADAGALAARVQRLLTPVRRLHATAAVPQSPGRDWLHVVHWNVLHGNRYEAVRDALCDEPGLAGADLLSLNEVDLGLARSGNRDVAFDLARALGMHAAWTALFLELEGGSDTPPDLARQEQAESLFGLALLSRFPLGEVRRVELETQSAFLFDSERKVGQLVALVAEVLRPGAPFWAVVTHLDVHRGPGARLQQMQQVLAQIPAGPAILCGDLNTTTFARGTWLRSVRALGVLVLAPSGGLRRRLLQPYAPQRRPHEPLFTALARSGFAVAPFNSAVESLDLRLDDVREVRSMPGVLRWLGRAALRRAERRGRHRLDWIAARGFEPARELAPLVQCQWMRSEMAASDHAPIGCGLRLRSAQ